MRKRDGDGVRSTPARERWTGGLGGGGGVGCAHPRSASRGTVQHASSTSSRDVPSGGPATQSRTAFMRVRQFASASGLGSSVPAQGTGAQKEKPTCAEQRDARQQIHSVVRGQATCSAKAAQGATTREGAAEGGTGRQGPAGAGKGRQGATANALRSTRWQLPMYCCRTTESRRFQFVDCPQYDRLPAQRGGTGGKGGGGRRGHDTNAWGAALHSKRLTPAAKVWGARSRC